jgi:alpha-galactosidase
MKIKTLLFSSLFLTIIFCLHAQQYATWDKQTLALDNGVIKRVINLNFENHGIVSNSMKLTNNNEEFLLKNSEEFYFEVHGKAITGFDKWNLVNIKNTEGENHGKGAVVILENPNAQLRISITYMMYPDLPVIRKKIAFNNTGKKEIKLEALDIEYLKFLASGTGTHCWVMNNYARQKSLGQFVGNWYDPVVVVHEIDRRRGIALGNEAPGMMKCTTAFLKPDLLTIGLTHPEQNFGFRKWIKPGELWESTWVFSAIYVNSDDPYSVLNGPVNDFIRKYLGTRLSQIQEKPVFVYNTWEPFLHKINDKLIYELVDAAAECGFQEFVIDDGWQTSYGDWGINPEKFPDGLKPVFDYIKSKGMKPGIWISLGAVETSSNVYKQHPEWLTRKADGTPINLQNDFDKMYSWGSYSMCMTTGWYDYIKGVILKMVKEYGLEYLKGDFAVVSGAYTTDKTRSGCHATNHPLHKDRNESMLLMYQRTWQLFDDLHKEAPNLFIDCTFETMGAYQLIDLDMCKHADGNWLSNFGEKGEKAPFISLRIRQMSWWRSPTIPATAMVIGNQHLDDPLFEISLKSLAGSLPIVLGDPRLLTKEQRDRVKTWSVWLQNMQKKHDFMSFRQDLPGFGEPCEGLWDGFQRINSETYSGGIVGIFRQGSAEEQRTVTVKYLDPNINYNVLLTPGGERIVSATGKDLAEKGFLVKFSKSYDGALYEICKAQ